MSFTLADEDGVLNSAETRAGVEPADFLLAERDRLVLELAPLWALYGPGGMGERNVSDKRGQVVELLRAVAAGEERKTTEAQLESASRAHKMYLDEVAKVTTERAQFFVIQERIRAIDFRLNRGQAMMKVYASEVRT